MTQDMSWLVECSPAETRAALVDPNGRLIELRVERMGDREIVGSIHLGRVTRVEKGIGAAFVEFGDSQPGFLGKAKGVTEGQAVIVQVVRAAGDGKGAVLTVNPILRGRYLSLDATRPGIHWPRGKWEGDRSELAVLLEKLDSGDCGIAPGPLAATVSAEILRAERERLTAVWNEIVETAARSKPPEMLRPAPALEERIMTEARGRIVMDDPRHFSAAKAIAERGMPDLSNLLELYKGDIPLFEEAGVEEQLEQALSHRLEMPEGASLAIEETEALTAIDVNMGGSGRASRPDNAIRQVNVAAAREVAHQIRLRNIGGLVVVDFISMKNKGHRKQLVESLRHEMREDPVRHDVLGMTPGGLVEITRQRVGRTLADLFLRRKRPELPTLPEAHASAALREALRRPWTARTVLAASPKIVELLQGPMAPAVEEVSRRLGVRLELLAERGKEGYEFRQG